MHAAIHPVKIRWERLEGGEREISEEEREIYLRKDPTVRLGGDLLGKKKGPTVTTIPAWESSVAALARQGVNPVGKYLTRCKVDKLLHAQSSLPSLRFVLIPVLTKLHISYYILLGVV